MSLFTPSFEMLRVTTQRSDNRRMNEAVRGDLQKEEEPLNWEQHTLHRFAKSPEVTAVSAQEYSSRMHHTLKSYWECSEHISKVAFYGTPLQVKSCI